MQLFRGRVLAATGAAILVFAVAAWFVCSPGLYPAGGAAVLLSGVLFLLLYFKKRMTGYRLFSLSAALVLFLLFLVRCGFFYLGEYRPAMQFAGGEHDVVCVVTERKNLTSYASVYAVSVRTVDGNACETQAILDCDYASDYPVGTVLELGGAAVEAAAEEYPGNVSDGIFFSLSVGSSYTVRTAGEEPQSSLRTALHQFNRRLASRLRQTVGGSEGKLCARMLLGGNDTEAAVQRDFQRAGVSHLLAVSGMHISLLCGALHFLLLRLRFGKKLRLLCVSLFVVGYLFLLDFPASAVRSGGMLLLSYAITMLGGDADGLTSLFVSLSVILFVQPAAILDTGFILSASATFGILTLSPLYADLGEKYRKYLQNKPRRAGKKGRLRTVWETCVQFFLKRIFPALAVMGSACLMTSVPVSFLFGRTSLLSPLSNLVLPVPAECTVLLSALVLLLPEGSFLQGMAAYYAKKSAGFLLRFTQKMSDVRGAELSLRAPFLRWVLILATFLTLVFLCIRLRHRLWTAAPFAAAVLCIAGYVCFAVPDTVHVFFTESGTDDAMAAVSHGTAVLADFSSGSGRTLSEAAVLAEEAGATEVEALLLTHYHARHVGSVERLLCQKKVRRLWLPEPVTQTDASVMLRLVQIAETCGAECRLYGAGEAFVIFETLTLKASGPEQIARSTHPVLTLRLSDSRSSVLYWGKSLEEWSGAEEWLPADSHTQILLGGHGPVQKKAFAEALCLSGQVHLFDAERLAFLVGGRDPSPWLGKIILHEKTAYFQLHS